MYPAVAPNSKKSTQPSNVKNVLHVVGNAPAKNIIRVA